MDSDSSLHRGPRESRSAALRPYQDQGIAFLSQNAGALLADEMGLGKTVQTAVALSLLLRGPSVDRALVVAPTSLTLNWERELGRWAPEVATRRLLGDPINRLATYQLPIPLLITSYEQLRVDAFKLPSDIRFGVVVLDEAQRIKNRDSSTSLACRLVQKERGWTLTVTHIKTSVDDLLALFSFLNPGLLRPGMTPDEVRALLAPHFLRRTKINVLPELPPIIEQDVPLELLPNQRRSYDDLWSSRVSALQQAGQPVADENLFALLTKLKQLCNYDPSTDESVKLDFVLSVVDSLSSPDDKLLLFSQYTTTLEWLSERLPIRHDVFHGALDDNARDSIVTTFASAPGPRALLVSIRAGGVGLNLQAASTVILFDRWWNPAVEDQAVHRAHRFGRTAPLHVMRLLVRDSIEERIDELLRSKRSLFESYIVPLSATAAPRISREELRQMLGLTKTEIGTAA